MSNSTAPHIPQELEDYRKQIDALDVELIDVFARRFDVVRKVGELKAREKMPVVQSARAQMVIDRAAKMASERGIDSDFVRKVYEMMIDLAHAMEHEIVDGESKG